MSNTDELVKQCRAELVALFQAWDEVDFLQSPAGIQEYEYLTDSIFPLLISDADEGEIAHRLNQILKHHYSLERLAPDTMDIMVEFVAPVKMWFAEKWADSLT